MGSLAYVVVLPPNLHVTDYVVNTGSWLGRDLVVPLDQVERISDGTIYLRLDRDQLHHLQDYVEIQYTSPPPNWAPVGGLFYPTQAVLWPANIAYPEDTSVTVNAPAGTVGITEGTTVESSDGHKIGTVKAVETDTATGNLVEVIVKEGFLFSHNERLPANLIDAVHADRLTLKLTKAELEQRTE